MNKEQLEKQSISLENIIAKLRFTLEEVEEIKENIDNELAKLPNNEVEEF